MRHSESTRDTWNKSFVESERRVLETSYLFVCIVYFSYLTIEWLSVRKTTDFTSIQQKLLKQFRGPGFKKARVCIQFPLYWNVSCDAHFHCLCIICIGCRKHLFRTIVKQNCLRIVTLETHSCIIVTSETNHCTIHFVTNYLSRPSCLISEAKGNIWLLFLS